MKSASNDAYRLFPLRKCWETDQEELRMKLDEGNHWVNIVITAPTNTSSIQFHQFTIFVLLRTKREKRKTLRCNHLSSAGVLGDKVVNQKEAGGAKEKNKVTGNGGARRLIAALPPSAVRHGGRGRRR